MCAYIFVVGVQPLSHIWLCDSMGCSPPGSSILHYLLEFFKLMSIKSVMLSNHLILCCPLFLLPSVFPSIRVFSSELALHLKWPKFWSFSFSISPSNEYSGLIFSWTDWYDLLALQSTLNSLIQHQNSKASVHIKYDHWENHKFNYTDLCQWSDVFAF